MGKEVKTTHWMEEKEKVGFKLKEYVGIKPGQVEGKKVKVEKALQTAQ